ncbi:MAG: CBS domain-containing protein [Nitrospirae bacterium]|nr:CBS domain-containing protein [Nitrospirota bacterium]
MLKVKDVLKTKGETLWTIHPNETAYRALEIMAEKDIGVLLVIERGQVAGILSERDYARKVVLKGKSSQETLVGDLMTKDVYSITTEKSIEECMALMTAAHCRHMPVYEGNNLAGLLTFGDIARAIMADQKLTITDLEHYIKGNGYVDTAKP